MPQRNNVVDTGGLPEDDGNAIDDVPVTDVFVDGTRLYTTSSNASSSASTAMLLSGICKLLQGESLKSKLARVEFQNFRGMAAGILSDMLNSRVYEFGFGDRSADTASSRNCRLSWDITVKSLI